MKFRPLDEALDFHVFLEIVKLNQTLQFTYLERTWSGQSAPGRSRFAPGTVLIMFLLCLYEPTETHRKNWTLLQLLFRDRELDK